MQVTELAADGLKRQFKIVIPAGDLSHVFEKFYRRKGTPQRGAGLGLAIVRRIVEDHDGTVGISSRLGEGTSVEVQLPMSEV